MSTVLSTHELGVSFGAIRALFDVSLTVEQGTTSGVVGANGSGKTTLLNLISGIYAPTKGRVEYQSTDVTNCRPHDPLRSGLVRTFQHPQLVPELSIRDNVMIGAVRRRRSSSAEAGSPVDVIEAIELVGAGEFAESLPQEVPFGIQKLVEVARALMAEPQVLLLDEPAAGLNSQERINLAVVLERMRQARPDVAVVLIEHDIDFMRRVADHLIALESGRMIGNGGVDEVLDSADVRRSLLGKVDDPTKRREVQ